MKVNFNNLRKNAANAYTNLVNTLNGSINDGFVAVPAEDIQKDLDDLRMMLAGVLCTYQEDNEDFADLADHCDTMPCFNDEEANENLKRDRSDGQPNITE
jgi:hypothetical protein